MESGPDPQELLQAFANSGDGVYAVDNDQRIVFWNEKAEQMLGYKAADVLGQRCYDVITGEDVSGHSLCGAECEIVECARRGHAVPGYEMRTPAASGEPRWLSVSIVVLSDGSPQSTLSVHVFRDVTEQQWRESNGTAAGKNTAPSSGKLTRRETEVLQLLASGMATPGIAEELGVSPATVRNHVEHLLAKLGVHSKLEAVVYAAQHHIV